MVYPYEENGGGFGDIELAGAVPDGEGACPPIILWYRIYPIYTFSNVFANPPVTVITECQEN